MSHFHCFCNNNKYYSNTNCNKKKFLEYVNCILLSQNIDGSDGDDIILTGKLGLHHQDKKEIEQSLPETIVKPESYSVKSL